MNSYCTASIIVRTTPEKGIKVQYYPTHYGHATSLGHLRLSEKERVTIAGNFLQGVTFERILDDIRCNVDTSLRRIHLTTRKDITNIQQAYGLRDFQHHADDATIHVSTFPVLCYYTNNKESCLGSNVNICWKMISCLYCRHHYKQKY